MGTGQMGTAQPGVAQPAPDVHPIEAYSYRLMAERVDLSSWPTGARDVVARMVHATADDSFARSAEDRGRRHPGLDSRIVPGRACRL